MFGTLRGSMFAKVRVGRRRWFGSTFFPFWRRRHSTRLLVIRLAAMLVSLRWV